MVTEITSQNWFQRIGNAIGGVVVGLILVLVAVVALWWNEGNSVHTAQSLKEGKSAVVSVPATEVSSENNGKLIHITGEATTDETLLDSDFDVKAQGDLRLRRDVQMYQWKQQKKSKTRKKIGGGEETVTSYEYVQEWSSEPYNSSQFEDPKGHENPPMPFQSQTFTAQNAHVGAFQLGDLTEDIDNFSPLEVDNQDYDNIHFGAVQSPKIGDVKVRFEVARPTTVSVVAQQSNDSLVPYQARSGGKQIYRLEIGQKSADEMFTQMVAENNMLTWVFRFVGWLFMFIGMALVLRPLSVVADIIPFVGDLVGMGTGLVAFATSVSVSLTVIAVAWIAYRPLLGIGLLLLAGGAAFVLFKKRR